MINCQKSQRSGPYRFRSHRKLHESRLCQMAEAAHQGTQTTPTFVQCGWNRKQKWSTTLLYGLAVQNGHINHKPEILPFRFGGPQGNLWIPLVCSLPAQSRLEKGVDWHLTTPYSLISTQCSKSLIHPQNEECPVPHKKGNWPILPWTSHNWVYNQWTKHCGPRGIQETQQSIQQGQISKTTPVHYIGSHHKTAARNT